MGGGGPELVDGQFSPAGRITEKSVRKLRHHVETSDLGLVNAALEASGRLSPTPSPQSRSTSLQAQKPAQRFVPTELVDDSETPYIASDLLSSSLMSPKGMKVSLLPASPSDRAVRDKISAVKGNTLSMSATFPGGFGATGLSDKALDESMLGKSAKSKISTGFESGGSSASASSPTAKLTCAFTSLGKDAENLCDLAGSLHRRFCFPTKGETKPGIGHYRVNDAVVRDRMPEWNFGEKPKHVPIRPKELDAGTELGESFSSFGSPFHRTSGLEQIGLATERPNLAVISKIRMSLASDQQGSVTEWAKQDEHSSVISREPVWDLSRQEGRKKSSALTTCQFFEAGKYNVNYVAVESPTKSGMKWQKVLSRAQTAENLGYSSPKAMLKPPTERLSADRSLYRGCAVSVQSKTHISDWSKDLDRPPLMKKQKAMYDEDDLEAASTVFEQEMSFDASSADHAVVRRRDLWPPMSANLARDRAGRGSRLLQGDIGMLHSYGIEFPETSDELGSVESTKEIRSRLRPDMGCRFNQLKGRYPKKELTPQVFSRLKQPRNHAAPEFARTAKKGFTSRASVDRPLAAVRSRTHEALENWDIEGRDEAETRPFPSA
ncbi:unnamed protein product [Polarella glacialis]|uniref:Uncharacterized protein n=1 Tax=Polarella glacialis TaxID=89957 RepID=A0A813LNN4_POLGL|nr:unnamed protein product [Polarella glacialis]